MNLFNNFNNQFWKKFEAFLNKNQKFFIVAIFMPRLVIKITLLRFIGLGSYFLLGFIYYVHLILSF